jgi:hypothetical protein
MLDEYDVSKMKGVVQGKYFRRACAGANLVLIEPELAKLFPDSEAVNRALRSVVESSRLTAAARAKRSKRG